MYKMCKTEASAERQRRLEQGLLDAMQVTDFADISVCDLCDQLHIPRKAFYRYFTGKEGALHALIDHSLMQSELKFFVHQDRSQSAINQRLEEFFLFWKDQKTLLNAITRSRLTNVLIERAIRHALAETNIIRRVPDHGTENQVNYTIMFAVCGLMAMTIEWYHRDFETSIQKMAQVACQLLTKPIIPKM